MRQMPCLSQKDENTSFKLGSLTLCRGFLFGFSRSFGLGYCSNRLGYRNRCCCGGFFLLGGFRSFILHFFRSLGDDSFCFDPKFHIPSVWVTGFFP